MASCDSQSVVDSLATWNHIKPRETVVLQSFSEIFGELHFKEALQSKSSLPFLNSFQPPSKPEIMNMKPSSHEVHKNQEKRASSLPLMNSESLNMCTEGLGFESFEDLEDSGNEKVEDVKKPEKEGVMKHLRYANPYGESRKVRTFPPPIPSLGRNGKPCVSYKSFRCDGRLVLKEITTSNHGKEFMHACREDGRLTLHLIHRDEERQSNKERARNDERESMEDAEDEEHGKGKVHLDEINKNSSS